ncbi:hypothetical protein GGH94_003609 [Coemansia aciculifera]|uniref:Uncharacterized protein n=1 Tax=Coemansia aciculifera TaxID=417176 RepID=A0A9W8IGU4_9FUNG|nr:hypothetical protein GGH94_003609 [Coemansia aciculifera]KAJ2873080.1 hypothetical protein GGH93_003515 [Coemansia aciculifera]
MQLSISAILAVFLQLSVGVLGAVISPHTAKPMWTEAPSVTKAVLANVEANLSRFVPHMLSEAKMMDLAAVVQGLRPAQAHGMPTAAVADLFWDGAEATAA